MAYQLRVISGEPAGGIFPLAEGENLVGRGSDCAVIFESAGVSRQHFLIRITGGRIQLENKGRFGTTVDDQTVESAPIELWPGSKIRFGMYMLVQFEESSSAGGAATSVDPDHTAEMPAFYRPEIPAPAKPQIGAEDSFFLRNDDIKIPPLTSKGFPAKPATALSSADPDESALGPPATRQPPRPSAPPPPRQDESDGLTDPSMMEFSHPVHTPSRTPAKKSPVEDDSGLFSSPAALPQRHASRPAHSAPQPVVNAAPPKGSPLDDGNHTRGLSPEAIAFMRQEWERKARGKRIKWILLATALILVAAIAAYFFFIHK